MATIVREARDPWWANLAVNVLGGLWNDYQQREQNKKINALQGEIASAISGLAGGQQDNGSGLMSSAGSNFGAGLGSTGGNAWENAFHQNDNPLADYDANMAGIAPTAQGQVQATPTQAVPAQATIQRQPTAQDIYRAFAGLMASKRFSGVNSKSAAEILTPYLTLNEQARAEQRRKELAEAYMNAPDDVSRLGELYRGAIEGYVPQSILTSGQGRYQYDNPYQQAYTQNTGQETRYGSFNPRTGTYTEAGKYKNELTPQQFVAMAQHEATLAENRRQFRDTLEYNREGREIAQRNADRAFEADQKAIQSTILGDDGTWYIVRKNGEREKLDPNSVGLSKIEESQIKALENRRKSLYDQLEGLRKARREILKDSEGGTAEAYKDGEKQANPLLQEVDDDIASIVGQIQQCETDIGNIFTTKLKQNESQSNTRYQGQGQQSGSQNPKLGAGTNVAFNMVSHANNGTISSAFGARRPNGRTHKGIDVAVGQGTPILVPDIGAPMTVKSVGTNPHHSYGNHVVLSGEITDRDGKRHTIEMTVAHMDNGSLNVQRGQKVYAGSLIGKVGNTGNTSDTSKPIKDKNGRVTGYQITNWYEGKKSGHHLHLETKIDGQHVDPEKFNELIYPYIMYEQPEGKKYTTAPNTAPSKTAGEVITERQNSNEEIIWRNPQTGKTITRGEDAEFRRKADNGELEYLKSSKNADSYYKGKGFERVGGVTSQPLSGDVTVVQSSPVSPSMTILGSGDIAPASIDWRPSYMKVDAPLAMTAPAELPLTTKSNPVQSFAPTYAEAVNHATSADIQQGLASLNGEFPSPDYILNEASNPFWSLANMRGAPWGYALDGRKPYQFSLLGS